ncbi:MAG TPA: hypothetical protein PKD54_05160 [Pirellulaceae bacterium]|nr:hypothetical protein [Pirellulaceae bacterium]
MQQFEAVIVPVVGQQFEATLQQLFRIAGRATTRRQQSFVPQATAVPQQGLVFCTQHALVDTLQQRLDRIAPRATTRRQQSFVLQADWQHVLTGAAQQVFTGVQQRLVRRTKIRRCGQHEFP